MTLTHGLTSRCLSLWDEGDAKWACVIVSGCLERCTDPRHERGRRILGTASASGSVGRHRLHKPLTAQACPTIGILSLYFCACAHFPHWPPLSLRTEDCLLAGQAAVTKPSFSAPLLNTYCVLGPGLVAGMQRQTGDGLSQMPQGLNQIFNHLFNQQTNKRDHLAEKWCPVGFLS